MSERRTGRRARRRTRTRPTRATAQGGRVAAGLPAAAGEDGAGRPDPEHGQRSDDGDGPDPARTRARTPAVQDNGDNRDDGEGGDGGFPGPGRTASRRRPRRRDPPRRHDHLGTGSDRLRNVPPRAAAGPPFDQPAAECLGRAGPAPPGGRQHHCGQDHRYPARPDLPDGRRRPRHDGPAGRPPDLLAPPSHRVLGSVPLPSTVVCPSTVKPAPPAPFDSSFSPGHRTLVISARCPPRDGAADNGDDKSTWTYRRWMLTYPSP